jgi:hypothetical protein
MDLQQRYSAASNRGLMAAGDEQLMRVILKHQQDREGDEIFRRAFATLLAARNGRRLTACLALARRV